jgi:hypothetical protein
MAFPLHESACASERSKSLRQIQELRVESLAFEIEILTPLARFLFLVVVNRNRI